MSLYHVEVYELLQQLPSYITLSGIRDVQEVDP